MNDDAWKNVYFHEVCDVNPTYKIADGEICSFIDMASVAEDSPQPRNIEIREYKKTSASKFRNGDVLFARITPCTENGKTALVQGLTTEFGFGSTEFIVLSPKDELDSKFLYYMVKDGNVRNKAIARMVGTTGRQRVPNEFFRDELEVSLPPLFQQRKVAAILTSVDDAIDATQRVIDQTEVVKRGLMQQLLTRGVGHTKFKQTEIGEIPAEWGVVRLSSVSNLITKGTTPTTYGFNYCENGINFIKVESIDEHGNFHEDKFAKISTDAHAKLSRSQIQEGDILFSIAGALGRAAVATSNILPANTNQALAIIRLSKGNLDVRFVFYTLLSSIVQHQIKMISTAGAQPNLSLKQVGDFFIPMPHVEEQLKIVKIISAIDARIANEKQYLSSLVIFKQGLMQVLLTGNVRVNVDEPSEVSV